MCACMCVECVCVSVHASYIFENLSSAFCGLDKCFVVVEGELLCGIEHAPPLLPQVLRFQLCTIGTRQITANARQEMF